MYFVTWPLSEGVAGVDFVRFTNLTAFQIQLHQSFSLRPKGMDNTEETTP